MNRLRQALAWLRRRGGDERGITGSIGTTAKHVVEERRHLAERRRRFWAELREGQREAEERARTCH